LVDSTGYIDVFIPDLPPTENFYGIYEVMQNIILCNICISMHLTNVTLVYK
jgi:hypothetical protein